MTEDTFNQLQKDGKVQIVKKPTESPPPSTPLLSLEEFQPFLEALRRPMRYVDYSTTPEFVPKNFLEAFLPFDDGVDRGVHIYINNNWRKITAT